MDLFIQIVSVHIDKNRATELVTDIFQVLLANLDQRRNLLDFLDWKLRETCRKDNVVPGVQRLVPEGAP